MTDNNYYDSSIDFIDLFKALWKKKYSIFFTTSLAALTSIIISLSLPNIYKSSSLLAPSSTNENLNSQLSSFSSVASLVGVNIPSGEITNSQEAIERIKSFNFFVNDFLPNIKLENLMAFDKWIPENNIIIYDDDLFDIEKNLWIRDVSYPKKNYSIQFRSL
jgi:hypothetical protein